MNTDNVTSINNRNRKAASTVANPLAHSLAATITGKAMPAKPPEEAKAGWQIENEAISDLVGTSVFHGEAANGEARELIAAVKADDKAAVEYVKSLVIKSYLLDRVVEQHHDEHGGEVR